MTTPTKAAVRTPGDEAREARITDDVLQAFIDDAEREKFQHLRSFATTPVIALSIARELQQRRASPASSEVGRRLRDIEDHLRHIAENRKLPPSEKSLLLGDANYLTDLRLSLSTPDTGTQKETPNG